jgi:hypothetical protein
MSCAVELATWKEMDMRPRPGMSTKVGSVERRWKIK